MGQEKPDKERMRLARQAYYEKVVGKLDESLLQRKSDRKAKEDQENILAWEAERLAKLTTDESNSIHVTRYCNKLLDETRVILKDDKPDANAVLGKFDQIRQRLMQAYDSREIRLKWFWWLFLLIVGFFVIVAFVIGWFRLIPGQDNLQNTAWVCLACALWGGIGSIIDAFVAMNGHFGQQDFDEHYLPWYFIHPFLGLSIGAVVYLVLQAGLLAISGMSLAETSANVTSASAQNAITSNISAILAGTGPTGKIGVTALPIALAFLGGFRQSTIINFLTRIVTTVFQGNQRSS